MRKLRQTRTRSWALLPTLRCSLTNPGGEKEKCGRMWRVQTSLLEMGKLRQQLIRPERAREGSLPSQENKSTAFPLPLGQETSPGAFYSHNRDPSQVPSWLSPSLATPMAPPPARPPGLSFSSQNFRENHSFPQIFLRLLL